jgi:Spy/CpxP family protein refolding chaperone
MDSKRWMVRLASGLVLLGGVALEGCTATVVGTPVPATAASSAADDDDLIADLHEHSRHHHQGGVAMFLALSLDTLGVPPEKQAAITKIQSYLFARMEPARLAEQTVLTTLADGVAAGRIDKAKVDAAISQFETLSGQVHEATVDALNQLHAVLSPPERSALVDKIWAHWSVFRDENADYPKAGQNAHTGHLGELTAELGLSPDQVAKITATFQDLMRDAPSVVDPTDVDTHVKRLAEFREDVFDAKSLSNGPAASARVAGRGATAMARFYEAVDPVLVGDQRAKLAALLREHATHQDAALVAAH